MARLMRAIWVTRHGDGRVLEVREAADPEPAPGEVRVRVAAAGLNFAEVMARQGLYPDAPKPPCVVGYEGAGVIDALGAGVSAPAPGTRVLFLKRFGAHASVVCVPASQVVAIPDAMSFDDAAAIPVAYLTAYHMLFNVARLRAGDHVLIHMAAGGVGIAALQLCRTVPGVVTYGTASAAKHEHLRREGCAHAIDYRTSDYVEEVRRLTGGRGVDVVLDALGGPDWKKSYSLLGPAGLLVAFGVANANQSGRRNLLHVVSQLARTPLFTPLGLMNVNRGVAGVNLGHLWGETELLKAMLEALVRLYAEGRIRPHIHARFSFAEAARAHAELEQGKNVGKVVLVP
ncbi:MAG: medium chain dehydrogenase/reductase family protein [Sorangiineae bacterium]|nr:medium chain dehydrogenase/reductase family protein [Polyangiaceae bacterium]MEB2323536.1 medium chain dehydrogenase/reductase family protein [Sorangiineae bacterium]